MNVENVKRYHETTTRDRPCIDFESTINGGSDSWMLYVCSVGKDQTFSNYPNGTSRRVKRNEEYYSVYIYTRVYLLEENCRPHWLVDWR